MNLMHKENPQQPIPTFDNVLTTSKAHFLMEVPGPKKAVRKRCRPCYDPLSNNKGAKKARVLTRKVKQYCDACKDESFLCIFCFIVKHDSSV